MPEEAVQPRNRELRLDEAVTAFLEEQESGRRPRREDWLTRYPEVAAELKQFFTDQDEVDRLTGPLRSALQATPPPDDTPHLRPLDVALFPLSPSAIVSPPLRHSATPPEGYELLQVLGKGGMGLVYKARQKSAGRLVALKLIRTDRLTSEADVQRFRNEAEAAAQLDHPHIVPVYEVGTGPDHCFFSMKLIEGGGLDGQLARFQDDLPAAARLVAQVARAVHHAHQRGILHRDLKPSNILLDSEGQPHVSDFGLAKRMEVDGSLTQTGAIVGTPQYMAPEQTSGRKGTVTTATDVYGLGAVLYALLAGRAPFQGETVLETLEQVREREPEPPHRINPKVDRDLETICLKCLEKEPEQRYGSAQALAEELESWLRCEPIQARRIGRGQRTWRWCRRNPMLSVLSALSVALALAFVAGLIASLWVIVGQRDEIRSQNDLTLQRDRLLRQNLYLQDIQLAWQALRNAELERMRELLDRHIPEVGEEDLRGFEWWHLRKRSQGVLREAARVTAHQGDVYCAIYSPDGHTLASAGKDGRIRIWDSATLHLQGEMSSGQGEVNEVVFIPNGRTLASAGDDSTVRLWDIASASQRAILRTEIPYVELSALAVSFDGKMLAAGGTDGRVWSWNIESGALKAGRNLGAGSIHYLAFAPDSQTLASANDDHRVLMLDPATLRELEQFHYPFGQIYSLAISRDGRTLAAGSSWGGRIVLWDRTRTMRFQRPILLGHHAEVESLSFSPDDTLLASGGRDGRVKLWEVRSGSLLASVAGQSGRVWCVTFAPDGARLVTARQDGILQLWNVQRDDHRTIRMAAQTKDKGTTDRAAFTPNWAAFTPDGRTLLTRIAKGELQRWDVLSGRRAEPAGEPAYSSTRPALSSNSRLASVEGDGKDLSVRDLSGPTVRVYRHEHPIATVAISSNGERVAFQDDSAGVWMWEAASGRSRKLAHLSPARGRLALAPDGGTVAVVDSTSVLLLDSVDGQLLATLAGHEKRMQSVVFSPDGRRLATCEADGAVRIWDCLGRQEPYCLWKQLRGASAVAFSPDGKTFASVGEEGKVILWDTAGGQELMSLDDHNGVISALAFSPDGKILAAAGVGHDSKQAEVTFWYGEGVRPEP